MEDPITNNTTNTSNEASTQPSSYMVHHNDTIVGFFDNDVDANDALHGYQMQNQIDINDTLEILKIL